MKAQIEKYLSDDKGTPSSTRLFSFYLLKFFIIFNILSLLFACLLLAAIKGMDINILLSAGMIWIVFNTLLAIMIFAPKQLNKIQEIKALVELAKNGK